ncbi:hypothetical protein PUNSTDRAFT_56775 [Punctularia strigosozonata HHB-11173 SS5]|uniref:uncharacterized protein n=1 Tax=Punctularia strigosozonata (strain HHB-11173) TaxID=741275 RepID=UPI0004417A1B|nr:uncharacterized protein PUNSTDRAFT_56775 [Punctularia strigosozonata HHB-11173 SS5]EIN14737.1 hypothetical protein PUNSTDRAFT_56775 [Punctularia strigosozonata HHB-11173 SS5]
MSTDVNAPFPDVMNHIEAKVDEASSTLRDLSLDIHAHPELMFEERQVSYNPVCHYAFVHKTSRHAHDVLVEFMLARGFEVTNPYEELPTAWRATYTRGSGGRTIGICAEMDALPGMGHACGHNLIAMSGCGIALAIKEALISEDVNGTVVLLGTPAEEGGAGKVTLLKKGAFKGMDACLMCHPGPKHDIGTSLACSICYSLVALYKGHLTRIPQAAFNPWDGRNALDAAVQAYSSIGALRQHIKPDQRVHGVIKGTENHVPQTIPDYSKMTWLIRAPSQSELELLQTRVLEALEAASASTGCTHKINVEWSYADLHQNKWLG